MGGRSTPLGLASPAMPRIRGELHARHRARASSSTPTVSSNAAPSRSTSAWTACSPWRTPRVAPSGARRRAAGARQRGRRRVRARLPPNKGLSSRSRVHALRRPRSSRRAGSGRARRGAPGSAASPEAAVLTRFDRTVSSSMTIRSISPSKRCSCSCMRRWTTSCSRRAMASSGSLELADLRQPLLHGRHRRLGRAPRRAAARASPSARCRPSASRPRSRPRCTAARRAGRRWRCPPGCGARRRRAAAIGGASAARGRGRGGACGIARLRARLRGRPRGCARSGRAARGSRARRAATASR